MWAGLPLFKAPAPEPIPSFAEQRFPPGPTTVINSKMPDGTATGAGEPGCRLLRHIVVCDAEKEREIVRARFNDRL